MTGSSDRLYRTDAVRELERRAQDRMGLTSDDLMERAGTAAFQSLRRYWPEQRRLLVVCGGGNNGGDGYVVARLARQKDIDVKVLALADIPTLPSTAAAAAKRFRDAGGVIQPFAGALPQDVELIIDALLGTGITRAVEGAYAGAIQQINAMHRPVLALDVPAGLNADTGAIMGDAVHADRTVTFMALKPGLVTGSGPECAGALELADLGVDPALFADLKPEARLLSHATNAFPLPRRARDAHKGNFGHVLVIGGDVGFAGAPLLAGEAAARVGCGLVTLATRPQHAGMQVAARPELMAWGVDRPAQLDPLLDRASVVAIGPGLGQSPWAAGLLARVLETNLPLVVDADGLTLLARDPVQNERWVLTPHPGEAARLLDCSTAEIQGDRFTAVRELQSRYGGVIVLKGCGSLVATRKSGVTVCTDGNPGLASGGTGDVLTGVIAGLMAQGLEPESAALTGACLHGAAADRAVLEGERGMLAGDLMPWLRRLVNPGT